MSAATEQHVQLAAELYRCRDSARFLLGDGYAAKMADYGKAISNVAEKLNCSALVAATKMAAATDDGVTQMLVFAAAVELAEPSAVGAMSGEVAHADAV